MVVGGWRESGGRKRRRAIFINEEMSDEQRQMARPSSAGSPNNPTENTNTDIQHKKKPYWEQVAHQHSHTNTHTNINTDQKVFMWI